jgi:branched-chain amino acid transport system ATP-binding protein
MGVLPSRGRIEFDGADVSHTTLEERVMAGIALVPEKRELFGTMPVEDNLILGGFRPMKQRVPNWRSTLDEVYTLFPRLKERRTQLAGTLLGRRAADARGGARADEPVCADADEPSLALRRWWCARSSTITRCARPASASC